jgi:hypothetical protein
VQTEVDGSHVEKREKGSRSPRKGTEPNIFTGRRQVITDLIVVYD